MIEDTKQATTVEVPGGYAMHKACGAEGRYGMHGVRVDENGAVATNGRILAVLPWEKKQPGLIPSVLAPVKAWEAASKDKGQPGTLTVSPFNGAPQTVEGRSAKGAMHREEEVQGEFPRWEQLTRQANDAWDTATLDKRVEIRLSVEQLRNLAEALGTMHNGEKGERGGVSLRFTLPEIVAGQYHLRVVEPIQVRPTLDKHSGVHGLIMPFPARKGS